MAGKSTWSMAAMVGLLPFASPTAGLAQQGDQPAAANSPLVEIVVTARRREEKLQSVPVAVTAFNQAAISEHEIQDGADLMRLVPSLFANSPTGNGLGFSIRGQGGGFGGSPGVVSYFAEVPIGAGTGIGLYYDLDNVQVLKGPQGTLFGRNTTGGAVLFEPKKPTNDFEGYFQETIGDYNWFEEQGAINVPVIDDALLVRFAVDRKTRDGYTIDRGPYFPGRDYDNVDYWAARLSVTIRPTDNFETYTMINSYYDDDHGPGTQLSVLNPNFPIGGPTFPLRKLYPGHVAFFAAQQAAGPRSTAFSTDNAFLRWNYGITNITRWDITDDLTFRNISSDNVSKSYTRWDVDGSAFPLLDNIFGNGNWYNMPTAVYTEEPQLQGRSFGEKLNWVTGLFYEYDHPTGYSVNVVNEFLGLLPSDPLFNPNQSQTKYKAAFAQATYDLSSLSPFLEGIHVTAGYRYSWIHVSSFASQYFPNGKCAQRTGFRIPNCTLAGSGDFAHGTYTFSVDYQITPDTLVYVSDATGFKQGGFNSLVERI
ncbi:MAG TPA: TonB-dependent receptor [Alphaproteobacteria bacterium]|nr:TonB-dependent receptor [Alphaproteobacteria bacterium]